jgi:hypothetical protein
VFREILLHLALRKCIKIPVTVLELHSDRLTYEYSRRSSAALCSEWAMDVCSVRTKKPRNEKKQCKELCVKSENQMCFYACVLYTYMILE